MANVTIYSSTSRIRHGNGFRLGISTGELCMGYPGMVSFYPLFFPVLEEVHWWFKCSILSGYVYRFFSGFYIFIGILWELMSVFLGDNWDSN